MIESIEVVEAQPVPTFCKTETVAGSEIGARLMVIYPQLFSLASEVAAGPPYARWHDHQTTEAGSIFRMEAGFPVAPGSVPPSGLQASELPGGHQVRAVHKGHYDNLSAAYRQVQEWFQGLGYRSAGAPWDWYVEDPETVGIDMVTTWICWPVIK